MEWFFGVWEGNKFPLHWASWYYTHSCCIALSLSLCWVLFSSDFMLTAAAAALSARCCYSREHFLSFLSLTARIAYINFSIWNFNSIREHFAASKFRRTTHTPSLSRIDACTISWIRIFSYFFSSLLNLRIAAARVWTRRLDSLFSTSPKSSTHRVRSDHIIKFTGAY